MADPTYGAFSEALSPDPQLLPNYPNAAPDLQAIMSALMGPQQQFQPVIQPSIGDYNEALNPHQEGLVGGVPYGTDPEAMSGNPFVTPPQTMEQPAPTESVPLPQSRPPIPFAAPGVGGKRAAPTAHHHLRRYAAHYLMNGR